MKHKPVSSGMGSIPMATKKMGKAKMKMSSKANTSYCPPMMVKGKMKK